MRNRGLASTHGIKRTCAKSPEFKLIHDRLWEALTVLGSATMVIRERHDKL